MPQPPSNNQISSRVLTEYTVGKGVYVPETTSTQATASLPVDNPPILICTDAVQFEIPAPGVGSFVFPNIPKRTNDVNPLNITQPGQQTLTIQPQDTLMIDLSLQNSTDHVHIAGYAITNTNTEVPGPFLGAATYTTFGVIITGTAGLTGVVFAKLYLQRG